MDGMLIIAVYCSRSQRPWSWPTAADVMGDLDRSIQRLSLSWLRQMAWGGIDGRMVPWKKMIADTPVVVLAWFEAISFVHKNWAIVMVPSRLEMEVDRRRQGRHCRQ
ncbi:hypothetical protein ACLOJK_036561 [Asimina triloba]